MLNRSLFSKIQNNMLDASDPDDFDKPLETLLDDAVKSTDGDTVTISALVCNFGDRGFGPLLVLFGLIAATPPIGGIPGVPTTMGVLTVIVALQILLGRNTPWIPDFISKRGLKSSKVEKARDKLSGFASRIDRLIGPKLEFIAGNNMRYVVAAMCALLGSIMPPFELFPFAAALPAGAIAMFGLSLMARDGVLMLLALALSTGAVYLVVSQVLL